VTPQEQIAHLRSWSEAEHSAGEIYPHLAAVCDLAERALLADDEAEAVRQWLSGNGTDEHDWELTFAVLRRLLGETP
jgi:hypothetical protein